MIIEKADDRQHGGSHYKTDYQHWNLLPEIGFGPEYYLGCATKYITRHASKNGAEDVRKAIHFLEKLAELGDQGKCGAWEVPKAYVPALQNELDKFAVANGIGVLWDEYLFLQNALLTADYEAAIQNAKNILATQYAGEATPEYVNQDR